MIRKTILASSILGVGLLIGACGNQTQTQMNSTNTSESSQPKVTESSRKSSESASNNEGVSSDSSKSTSSTTESEILKGLAEENAKRKIPSLNQTTIKKVTDNEYKRILVMEEKATGTTYKSILIKTKSLKIVNETTDECCTMEPYKNETIQ